MPLNWYWDERLQSDVVRTDGPWIVSVTPMIYNDRIYLTHVSEYPNCAVAGYCYDKGGGAYLAAAIWDPLTEDRPVGFKKIAFEDLAVKNDYNEKFTHEGASHEH